MMNQNHQPAMINGRKIMSVKAGQDMNINGIKAIQMVSQPGPQSTTSPLSDSSKMKVLNDDFQN